LNFLFQWYEKSSATTIFVVALLSFYFIVTLWVFFYRYFFLYSWKKKEKTSSDYLLLGNTELSADSFLYNCKHTNINENFLNGCLEAATKEATSHLWILSIFASTAPFVGLFGTVVGILDSFATFKEGVTLSSVAPVISEALIATAFGIIVAVPAYATHLFLKREAYEIISYLKMQIRFLLSYNINHE